MESKSKLVNIKKNASHFDLISKKLNLIQIK
jgi:hypothetical protein